MARHAGRKSKPTTARAAAALALARAAEAFPQPPILEPNTTGLSPEESRLAVAIYRTAMQRWLTLDHLLGRFLKKKLSRLEPLMQGVLLGGAAQLIVMERLPVYAVVDESVGLARSLMRPGAAKMVNAVLRRVASLAGPHMPDLPWSPAADRLPHDPGGIALAEAVLPPVEDDAAHLSVATSHPRALVKDLLAAFDRDSALAVLAHSIKHPPTFVHEPDGRSALWQGTHDELVARLAGDARRRVQDPTSAGPVEATRGLSPGAILDLCAGRGTKTRQLAAVHPDADIVACDPDPDRFADLQDAAAALPRVAACDAGTLGERRFDLILLDVPCTNSGVYARRPEAKYRYTPAALTALAALQRKIIEHAAGLLAPGGHVLYATCSIHAMENQKQAAAVARLVGGRVEQERLTLPGGSGDTYHDGGYHALVRAGEEPNR